MNQQLWWYVARSGGIVAWALLAASVLWGLALSTKVTRGRPRPNWILDLHRFLGGLALIFAAVHVVALVLDSYVHFGLTEILVPFASAWHPAAVAWGVIGLYLLVAVELTSLARKRISKRMWRMTHFLSFPLFLLTTVHALTAGTDRSTFVLRSTVIAMSAVVSGLTFVRVRQVERSSAPTSPIVNSAEQRRVLSGTSQGSGAR
ncbi:MAG TPA: ferric reductase-like transmembrane domain-containing protein [Ilumatobacteraceae bacterium]|nr:ferric reductase-like transmembrane domain-containing protein [Ilumatobacteraceae bacterium]